MLVSTCQGNGDENQSVNQQTAQENAQSIKLMRAESADESSFNISLVTSGFPQLKATMEVYSKTVNQDLLSSISHELYG